MTNIVTVSRESLYKPESKKGVGKLRLKGNYLAELCQGWCINRSLGCLSSRDEWHRFASRSRQRTRPTIHGHHVCQEQSADQTLCIPYGTRGVQPKQATNLFFGWLTLKGLPSPQKRKRASLGNWDLPNDLCNKWRTFCP